MYVHGECYRMADGFNTFTWPAAVKACEQHSAYLASPRSVAEARWIFEVFHSLGLLAVSGEPSVWLGINDIAQEGVWRPVDGGAPIETSAAYWQPGQPDSRNYGNENCVSMRDSDSGRWWDTQCVAALPAVCKYNATMVPTFEGTFICCIT